MKQIPHSTIASLAITCLLSVVAFLFFSTAFNAIETVVNDIQSALQQGGSITYQLSHY